MEIKRENLSLCPSPLIEFFTGNTWHVQDCFLLRTDIFSCCTMKTMRRALLAVDKLSFFSVAWDFGWAQRSVTACFVLVNRPKNQDCFYLNRFQQVLLSCDFSPKTFKACVPVIVKHLSQTWLRVRMRCFILRRHIAIFDPARHNKFLTLGN